jgi:hypothetical protein
MDPTGHNWTLYFLNVYTKEMSTNMHMFNVSNGCGLIPVQNEQMNLWVTHACKYNILQVAFSYA